MLKSVERNLIAIEFLIQHHVAFLLFLVVRKTMLNSLGWRMHGAEHLHVQETPITSFNSTAERVTC